MRRVPVYYSTMWLNCRTPSSTLFPYTTLFRSWQAGPALVLLRQQPPGAAVRGAGGWEGPHPRRPQEPGRRGSEALRSRGEDLKSTRLNSSHVEISYAVFCLKKKKKKHK